MADDDKPRSGRGRRNRPGTRAKAPAERPFDMWLQKQLHAMYDEIAGEPLPDDLLSLIDQRRRRDRRRRKSGSGKPGKKIAARNFRRRPSVVWAHQTEASIMLASEDKKKALTSPSSVFKHPGDVVACEDLEQGREDRHPQAVGARRALAAGRHRGRHERGRAQPVRRRQEGPGQTRRRCPRRGRRADQGRPLTTETTGQ